MANVPAGGVKKRLTLQTKRRYQISSPTQLNSSGKGESFSKCENVARKQLFTLCVPKSSVVPPLPISKLQIVKDDKAEKTCFSSLPTPNFKLLTNQRFCPLDLKKCQPAAVSVSDERDVFNTTKARQSPLSTGMHGAGEAVSRDAQKKRKSTELSYPHMSGTSRMVQKIVGVTAAASTAHVGRANQAQRKPVKVKSYVVASNNSETRSLIQNNQQKTRMVDDRLTKAGQGLTKGGKESKLCFSDKQESPEGKSSRKRTWTEAGIDDDEFDELCNMVDLSFDSNVINNQVTEVTTPHNSQGGNQSVHHTTSTAIGSTRRTWTCPVCNEQFEGRSAEDPACEQHMIQCLAMDVV